MLRLPTLALLLALVLALPTAAHADPTPAGDDPTEPAAAGSRLRPDRPSA
jgi:hypothetical protein